MVKDPVAVKGNITITEAFDVLFKKHIGTILVVDDEQRCIGIFTERDAIRIVAQNVPLDAEVEKVMTKNLFVVDVNSPFKEAKEIIKTHQIRHLPVVDGSGKLVGLISVRNILDIICDL
jgi:CBS domain-containing protein